MFRVVKRNYYGLLSLLCILFQNLFLRFFLQKPKYGKKYKLAICGIFKNEAPFLTEWIEFHEMMGVEHFYLYNNNSVDNYRQVLQPYIERGIVSLIDWPYDQAQIMAYQNFYETYRQETQWVSFLDIDEFFCPRYAGSIIEWLQNNDKYPVILVYWKMFGSSGKLRHDYNQLVIEQYTISWDSLYHVGKCLINTDYDIARYDASTHHLTKVRYPLFGGKFSMLVFPVNQFGRFVSDNCHLSWFNKENKVSIQINHYWSKAWDVYDKKRNMTDVYFKNNPKRDMSYFYAHEMQNRIADCSMARFLIKLKLKLGLYNNA